MSITKIAETKSSHTERDNASWNFNKMTVKIINTFVGDLFAGIAGSLPVVAFSYIRLRLPFKACIALSILCFSAAIGAYMIGQKLLGVREGRSFFQSPIHGKLCVQYAAFRGIKAFLQTWGVVTGHLLIQRCLVLPPIVRTLSPLGAGIALVSYLFIDIYVLNILRLTKENKKLFTHQDAATVHA